MVSVEFITQIHLHNYNMCVQYYPGKPTTKRNRPTEIMLPKWNLKYGFSTQSSLFQWSLAGFWSVCDNGIEMPHNPGWSWFAFCIYVLYWLDWIHYCNLSVWWAPLDTYSTSSPNGVKPSPSDRHITSQAYSCIYFTKKTRKVSSTISLRDKLKLNTLLDQLLAWIQA